MCNAPHVPRRFVAVAPHPPHFVRPLLPAIAGRDADQRRENATLFTSSHWGEVASQRGRPEMAGPMTGSASG